MLEIQGLCLLVKGLPSWLLCLPRFDIFGGSNAWVSWGVFGIILVGFEFWLGCGGGGGGGGDDGGGGGDGPGGGGA